MSVSSEEGVRSRTPRSRLGWLKLVRRDTPSLERWGSSLPADPGSTSTSDAKTLVVLGRVLAERRSQERRYGATNGKLVSGTGPQTRWLLPYTTQSAAEIQEELREDYEEWEDEQGLPTWAHLVREEIAEAFQEPDGPALAEELIQVAALCVSWVERMI